jgi:hypothetical protein
MPAMHRTVIVFLACLVAAPAMAQKKKESRAAKMLSIAVEFQEEGKHEEALEILEKAHRVFRHVKLLYYKAISLHALGRYEEAKSLLEPIVDHHSLKKHRDGVVALLQQISDMLLPVAVLVQSEPAGAWVEVNGERKGVTPLKVSLVPRAYQLRIVKAGYDAAEQKLEVQPGQAEGAVEATLSPSLVDVQVTTVPPNLKAVLALDDKEVGSTPFATRLVPGDYRIRLNLDGYKPTEQSAQVKVGEPLSLAVPMEALPQARPPPTAVIQQAPPPSSALAWTLIAGGATATLAGAGLVLYHYKLKGELRPATDTQAAEDLAPNYLVAGAGAAILGLGAIVLGTLSFPDAPVVAVAPAGGGALATLTFPLGFDTPVPLRASP